jgi:hypothetical protein
MDGLMAPQLEGGKSSISAMSGRVGEARKDKQFMVGLLYVDWWVSWNKEVEVSYNYIGVTCSKARKGDF